MLYLIFSWCKWVNFILDIKNKSLSNYFALYLIIFTNLFNEIFYNHYNIFIPYYLYYFLKFQKNQKISELFKIVILYLLKSYTFYFYSLVIEFYFLLILSIYFKVYTKNNFLLIFKNKNFKYFFVILILTSLIFFNYYLLNENYIVKDFTNRNEKGHHFRIIDLEISTI